MITIDIHYPPTDMPDADTDVLVWADGDEEAQLGTYVGHESDGPAWVDAQGAILPRVVAWAEMPHDAFLGTEWRSVEHWFKVVQPPQRATQEAPPAFVYAMRGLLASLSQDPTEQELRAAAHEFTVRADRVAAAARDGHIPSQEC